MRRTVMVVVTLCGLASRAFGAETRLSSDVDPDVLPDLTRSSFGSLFVAWQRDNLTNTGVFAACGTASNLSFGPAFRLFDTAIDEIEPRVTSAYSADDERIEYSAVYLLDNPANTDFDLRYQRLSAPRANPCEIVSAGTGFSRTAGSYASPDIASDGPGNAYVSWVVPGSPETLVVGVVSSGDATGFASTVTVPIPAAITNLGATSITSRGKTRPEAVVLVAAVSAADGIALSWSTNGGQGFCCNSHFAPGIDLRSPTVELHDDAGGFYLSFAEQVSGNIGLRRGDLENGSIAWITSSKVNSISGAAANRPHISALARTKLVYAVWQYGSISANPNVVAAFSTNLGVTFVNERVVTTSTAGRQSTPRAAVGSGFQVWEDDRGGANLDIWISSDPDVTAIRVAAFEAFDRGTSVEVRWILVDAHGIEEQIVVRGDGSQAASVLPFAPDGSYSVADHTPSASYWLRVFRADGLVETYGPVSPVPADDEAGCRCALSATPIRGASSFLVLLFTAGLAVRRLRLARSARARLPSSPYPHP